MGQAIDQMTRDVGVAIDRDRIEMLIQERADFGEGLVQLRLLGRRDPRLRHRPIRNETSEKQTLREPERLRPREKQFFRLPDFLLPLNLRLVHKLQM